MAVRLVRYALSDCKSDCPEWISAEGDIVDGTPAEFGRILARIGSRKLPVFIHSGGGSIEASIAIGHLLRARGLDVSVTRTDFAPCVLVPAACAYSQTVSGHGVPGLPDSNNAYCASACTLVLAAGTQRLASPWSLVGVHQIIVFKTQFRIRRTYRVTTLARPGGGTYTQRTLIREQRLGGKTTRLAVDSDTYQPVDAYLTEMGIAGSMVPLMEATPNSDIHWMTEQELDGTRVVTRHEAGQTLLKLPSEVPIAISAPIRNAAAQRPARSSDASGPDVAGPSQLPVFFQGRIISLIFSAAYLRATSEVMLTAALRHGKENLPSLGHYVSFALQQGRELKAINADESDPFAPLAVTLSGATVCAGHAAATLNIGLHTRLPQPNDATPADDAPPISVAIANVPGLGALLAKACGSVAATAN